jgi:NifU-like protein involved in Fe-S cluster formation
MMAQVSRPETAKLYTPQLLALSTELARFPLVDDFAHRAEARSRTCGSTIELGLELDSAGNVGRIGMAVSACAIGQSSAAIMALAAAGRTPEDFAAMQASIERWLASGPDDPAPLPDWPGFDALAPALPHKGRHGALLLAWNAMAEALSSARSSR